MVSQVQHILLRSICTIAKLTAQQKDQWVWCDDDSGMKKNTVILIQGC